MVLEKKIFKLVFSLFFNYLPTEKGGALRLNNLESSSPKDALCQIWLKLVGGSGEEDENVKRLRTNCDQKGHLS